MKAQVRRMVAAALSSPVRAPTLALIRASARRLPGSRGARAVAFYAGEHLAAQNRVLVGRVPTGSDIELMSRDQMHRHIYLHGVHEPATTRFLMSVTRPGMSALDVGANAGYFSLLLADLVGPRGTVYAFEPNPELFAHLQGSASRRKSRNLIPVEAALGRAKGRSRLYMSTDAANSGLSTLEPEVAGAGARSLKVYTMTIDEFCNEHSLAPDLIKIDVEGHERAVLAGASGLLQQFPPRYVVCELETARNPAAPLIEVMSGYGYRACSLTEKGLLMAYEDRPVQNVVFAAEPRP